MDAPLFRRQATRASRSAAPGEPLLPSPLGQQALATLAIALLAAALAFVTLVEVPRRVTVRGYLAPTGGLVRLRAPTAATVVAIEVAEGDEVMGGQLLLRLDERGAESLQSRQAAARQDGWLRAPLAGQVLQLNARLGTTLRPGQQVTTILPTGSTLEAVLLVPPRDAGMLSTGLPVRLRLDAFPHQRFGSQHARITRIAGSVSLPGEQGSPFEPTEPVFEVAAALESQEIAGYGRRWRLRPDLTLEADVVLERTPLAQRLLDPLRAAAGAER